MTRAPQLHGFIHLSLPFMELKKKTKQNSLTMKWLTWWVQERRCGLRGGCVCENCIKSL